MGGRAFPGMPWALLVQRTSRPVRGKVGINECARLGALPAPPPPDPYPHPSPL